MAVRRLSQPRQVGVYVPRAYARPAINIECLLFVIAVSIFLFVSGIWVRNSLIGERSIVMATITVRDGDTLWNLAQRYGDPDEYILERVHTLVRANGLKPGQALRQGQPLVITVANPSVADARLSYGGRYACSRIAE